MNFIITGASRGLGQEFANFASEFGGIIGIIASNQEKLKAVAGNLKNCSVITYTCDFSSQEEIDTLVSELQSDFKKVACTVPTSVWIQQILPVLRQQEIDRLQNY